MSKIKQIGTFILIALICSMISSCSLIKKYQAAKIAELEDMVATLEEETIPLKFKILDKNDGKITVMIKFLDLNGEIAKEETLELTGEELFFDSQIIKLERKDQKNKTEEQYMFFPFKIYTDEVAPENGIELCSLYDENDFPAIYKGFDALLPEVNEKLVLAYSEMIIQTFAYIRAGEFEKLSNQYGSAVHDMEGISEFKKGYLYSVVCHPHTGAVEIMRE